MTENKYRESLVAVNDTIANCDNKASALLAAVGIVFGFSLFSVQELSNKQDVVKTLSYIFGILYLIAFVISIILLVSIVFPRRRKKKERIKGIGYPLYSEGLYEHILKGDIDSFVEGGYKNDALLEQIKICVRIAHIKENLLRVAVWFIASFTISLVALVVCLAL